MQAAEDRFSSRISETTGGDVDALNRRSLAVERSLS
jgi:hypothetical protein